MKYFIMGAVASGMLLYGMSLIYGETHSIMLQQVGYHLLSMPMNTVTLAGTAFILVAVCFKLGAVPFHMWVPDVYEGSPTATTIYLGSVPKLAAFAMLIRLLVVALPSSNEHWRAALVVIAILCLVGGNLAALLQKNLKRLLAYSTIGHVGFILLGVAVGTFEGFGAALFYSLIYVLMAVGGFAIILILSKAGNESDKIDDLAGLNTRHSWLAFMMLLIMFSLAGVPPMVGFTAKLVVLKSLVAQGDYYLAGLALLMSVVAAYYYIRVVKVMYFEAPTQSSKIEIPTDMNVAISINGLLMILLGLLPAGLLAYCYQVFT
jgi:NADH-quinone oxidoreductase subunit N